MQQTGTLRKRRRRNLAKVNGLSTIPYDSSVDTFTARDFITDGYGSDDDQPSNSKKFTIRSKDYTQISMSSKEMSDIRRDTSASTQYSRVTRDPRYHGSIIYNDEEASAFEEEFSVGLGAQSEISRESKSVQERSHFLDKYYIQRMKQLLILGTLTGNMPWKWDPNKYRIVKWSSFMVKLWWLRWILETAQTFGLTYFQVHMFLEGFKTGNERTNRQAFMSSFGALWYTYALSYKIYLFFYMEQTRQYINSMLRFNSVHVRKYVIHLDDYEDGGHPAINLCFFSNLSQILISLSLFLRMPFQPWYLFSYIYPKPWYWLVPGAIHEMVLVGQVIIPYLLISWVIVAHANSTQFWLREIHNNNDSDYTSDDIRHPRNAVQLYKGLQMLNKVFNECMAPMAIPLMKIVMATAMIPCGYVLIRSMNHLFIDEFPGILTYPFSILDCGVVGFVLLTMSAGVFDLGCSFIDSWSQTKQKDFRRILMSCPTLKVWTGKFYVVTISTAITFFKVVFDIITDCIITFP